MKRPWRQKLVSATLNTLYFVGVFVIALAIGTLALTRKINSYQGSQNPLLFYIQKQEITINNVANGEVKEILVTPGQHVKKGDLMVQMQDDSVARRISTLQEFASVNVSARTEAGLLESQASQYDIRAPRDGVVYKIHVSAGAFLTQSLPVVTIFSDADIKLTGYVNSQEYVKIQKQKKLDMYNARFGQIYSVILEGAGRVIPATKDEAAKYELVFRFTDPEEGAAFIQGESLEVAAETKEEERYTPALAVARFWNSFIIGK